MGVTKRDQIRVLFREICSEKGMKYWDRMGSLLLLKQQIFDKENLLHSDALFSL